MGDMAYAITDPVRLLRACLNTNDSTVTIDYRNPVDGCGSFSAHHIYGKEFGPTYNKLAVQSSNASTSVTIKLANVNPTWTFYFQTLFLCNGADSIQSNTISVDISKPMENAIDSVSVDLTTQNIIIGWQPNSSKDVKGYRVYKDVGGINSVIDDTEKLEYQLAGSAPSTSVLSLKLAAYDSCSLFSTISNPHSNMVLNDSYDPCSRDYTLNWTAYIGWSVSSYSVYISLNSNPLKSTYANISSTGMTLKLSPGDSICVFVRAYKSGSAITSSSNLVCYKVPALQKPRTNYLSVASVAASNVVDIEIYIDNIGPSDEALLYRLKSSGVGEKLATFPIISGVNTLNYSDAAADKTSPNSYFIITNAPCYGLTSSSDTVKTVFLALNENQDKLRWTPYIKWDGGVALYELWAFNGSTWNMVWSGLDYEIPVNEEWGTCFKIVAKEGLNSYGFQKESHSNTVCISKEPTFYVPNALNSAGINHRFRVIGTSLDYDNSSFELFDRWGNVFFKTEKIDVGWDLLKDGEHLPTGVYFYVLHITDLSGIKHKSSGTFRVIR